MMNFAGYVALKKTTTTHKGIKSDLIETFQGAICPVVEFDNDGSGALVLNPQGTALGMFDKSDFESSFECFESSNVLMPISLKDNFVERMMYMNKVVSRKGGYSTLLKNMIIVHSLNKRQFDDSLLWQNQ